MDSAPPHLLSPLNLPYPPLTPPGSNMLLVGIQGPRAPCEELQVKHLGRQLYSVAYVVRERGEHLLVLKWGDHHVPHSPFRITVP